MLWPGHWDLLHAVTATWYAPSEQRLSWPAREAGECHRGARHRRWHLLPHGYEESWTAPLSEQNTKLLPSTSLFHSKLCTEMHKPKSQRTDRAHIRYGLTVLFLQQAANKETLLLWWWKLRARRQIPKRTLHPPKTAAHSQYHYARQKCQFWNIRKQTWKKPSQLDNRKRYHASKDASA